MKMINKPTADHTPSTPTRAVRKASGGGAKKLQQLLGASESDIDLLLRPAEILSTQTHRVSNDFESLQLLVSCHLISFVIVVVVRRNLTSCGYSQLQRFSIECLRNLFAPTVVLLFWS